MLDFLATNSASHRGQQGKFVMLTFCVTSHHDTIGKNPYPLILTPHSAYPFAHL
jgi:hypothetical protein